MKTQTQNDARKYVDYSYSTSPNAVRFGFGKTGCYVVQIQRGINPPKAVAAFATPKEATAYAETLPERWHQTFSSYYSPEAKAEGLSPMKTIKLTDEQARELVSILQDHIDISGDETIALLQPILNEVRSALGLVVNS